MVEPDQIDLLQLPQHAGAPPREPGPLHPLPVVDRVAPVLPVGGEVVRGHARDDGRLAVGVEQELVRVGPHVGRVEGHEDRRVADHLDAAIVGEPLQCAPLPLEEELPELVQPNLARELLFNFGLYDRVPPQEILRPLDDARPAQ